MNTVALLFSQLTTEHPFEAMTLGGVVAWFMFRWERFATKQIASTDRLGHKFEGVQRAMLIMEINRDNCNPTAQRLAAEMLEELQMEKKARERKEGEK